MVSAGKLEQAREELAKRDPNWSMRVFLDKAQTTFYLVQKAWTSKKPEVMKQVASDSLLKRHTMQLEQMKKKGQTNVLEDIVIGRAKAVDIRSEGGYDSITVKFEASMVDYTVDDKTNRLVEGDANEPVGFVEYWTFTRKTGQTTVSEDKIKAQKCPNCGAPLSMGQAGECEYCGVSVLSSTFDWVLDSIEQEDDENEY